jgi:hypothetical protein
VGVAGAPDPDTGGVSSIVAQWRGILSVKSDLGGGTPMTGNGKVQGNRGLKCGVKLPTSKVLNGYLLWF